MKTLKVSLPTGEELTCSIPDQIDEEIAKVIFLTALGTVSAMAKIKDQISIREFLIRYASVVVSEAQAVLHSCQMANTAGDRPTDQIIEDLLKSIKHKPK